jgi:protein TonB
VSFTERLRWLLLALCAVALLSACSSRPRAPSEPSMTFPSFGTGTASARSWDDYRVDVGRRIIAANPNGTYTGLVPEPLLAIPVLEIDLNRDGSVRNIRVQRPPSQAQDTVQLAIDAVRRAAPFGDVSHLPQPWRVSEVFLFREDRKFKPRSLD